MALLKQPNPRAPTGLRNLCIISLMLKLGLRVSEIINLRDSNIDWAGGRLHIEESRAARERILWLDQAELTLLKGWMNIKPAGSNLLFCTLDGGMLKDRYIREMIKRLAIKAGIGKDVYPHLLRYTFAVDFIREIRDISLLQEALGHRDPAATQAYTKLLFNDSKDSGFSNTAYKRSGMPVPAGQQQRIAFYDSNKVMENSMNTLNETGVSPRDNLNHAGDRKEGGEAMINGERSPYCKDSGNNNDRVLKKPETEAGRAARESENKPLKDNINNEDDNDNKPDVTIVSDSSAAERIKIPPIKCSQCSYILRYQGDCPKCGASFNAIMRHWGKII